MVWWCREFEGEGELDIRLCSVAWRGEKGFFSERVILVFCGALEMESERGER